MPISDDKRADPLDIDLSGFEPALPAKPKVEQAFVRQVSEATNFPSRAPAQKPKPAPRQARRRRTGRNVQFNIKATPETIARFTPPRRTVLGCSSRDEEAAHLRGRYRKAADNTVVMPIIVNEFVEGRPDDWSKATLLRKPVRFRDLPFAMVLPRGIRNHEPEHGVIETLQQALGFDDIVADLPHRLFELDDGAQLRFGGLPAFGAVKDCEIDPETLEIVDWGVEPVRIFAIGKLGHDHKAKVNQLVCDDVLNIRLPRIYP
jgi:hypothetical protein